MRIDYHDDDGRLVRRDDDTAERVYLWDADGNVTDRPYKPAEKQAALARAQALQVDHQAAAAVVIADLRRLLDRFEAAVAARPARAARIVTVLQRVRAALASAATGDDA